MWNKKGFAVLVLAICGGISANTASAALVTASAFSGVQTNFDANILNNDLVENGSAALSGVTTNGSVSTYPGDVAPANSFDHLTDGIASSGHDGINDISGDTYFDTASFSTNPSITYSFASPTGVSLSSVNVISGWANNPPFSHQKYQVLVSFVGSPAAFVSLANIDFDPWASNPAGPGGSSSTQVTLTDNAGALATGVAAIQFKFLDHGQPGGQVFREIDVTGAAVSVVPEPASLSLLAIGGLTLLRRRK